VAFIVTTASAFLIRISDMIVPFVPTPSVDQERPGDRRGKDSAPALEQ
jgi:hypothetical protein